MRLLRAITEDEMVAVFLQTELHSARFGADLRAFLDRDGLDPRLLDAPALEDAAENAARRRLLGEFRGYGRNAGLFIGFPDRVEWFRATLTPAELGQVRYIDYSYWNALSQGTRLPAVAARTVRAGRSVYGQSTAGYLALAAELRRGARFPELILTAVSPAAPRVVMEGHVRLTAYALAPECLPAEVEVLIGFSPDFPDWGAHGHP